MNPVNVPSLYLDTSVIGGYYDPPFQVATRELWQKQQAGKYRFVSSLLVDFEISTAPQQVQDLMQRTFTEADLLPLTVEVEALARAYMAKKIVPSKYADDATHVAIAVVHRVPVLVSWNFKHLVNRDRRTAFNAVNLLQGYPPVDILSPLEL
ncbi:MAG: hypothetical protein PHD76_10585 [Methylacidiphilales bacterium]|nr:hypothetical protein [Candidatus Methylacidiphilales bacterium]